MQQGQPVEQFVHQAPTTAVYPVLVDQGGSVPLIQPSAQYPTYYYQQQPQPAPVSGVKCVNCGTVNNGQYNFCSSCGYQLGGTSSVPTQQLQSALPEKMVAEDTPASKTSCLSSFKLWSITGLLITAAAINALLITIWLFADHGFPWFIYPLSGTFAVATFVYVFSYLTERKLITLHLLLSLNLNVLLVFTYMFAFSPFPWFIYVVFPSMALFALHFLIEQYRDTENNGTLTLKDLLFRIHLFSFFAPLNIMLFITFVASNPDQPWFLYPVLITACPLSMHYIFAFQSENPRKWFLAHLSLFCHTNLFFFMVWYVAGHGFPWFIFILGLTAIAFLIHYGFQFHRSRVEPHFQGLEKAGAQALSQMKEKVTSHPSVSGVVSSFTVNNNETHQDTQKTDATHVDV